MVRYFFRLVTANPLGTVPPKSVRIVQTNKFSPGEMLLELETSHDATADGSASPLAVIAATSSNVHDLLRVEINEANDEMIGYFIGSLTDTSAANRAEMLSGYSVSDDAIEAIIIALNQ